MNPDQIRQAALEIAEEAIRRARSGSWTLDEDLSELDRLDILAELERIAEEVARAKTPPAREVVGHVVLTRNAASGSLGVDWDGELHAERDDALVEVGAAKASGEDAVLGEVVADDA